MSYQNVRDIFLELCEHYSFDPPDVIKAFPSDPCDYTSITEVRINVEAAKGLDERQHAAHVFGHWLCELHAEGTDEIANRVADVIADVLRASGLT